MEPETSNLSLAPIVNAALAHVSTALGVSKSTYVEALLRVKFGITSTAVPKNFEKEGVYEHLRDESLAVPPELKTFRFDPTCPAKKRKPGRLARAGVGNVATHNSGFIGSASVTPAATTHVDTRKRKN